MSTELNASCQFQSTIFDFMLLQLYVKIDGNQITNLQFIGLLVLTIILTSRLSALLAYTQVLELPEYVILAVFVLCGG
ncbi:MAG: hypothetical protein LBC61_00100 [Candidatus Peribacteria bacterium]|nr:hypothetical protein [Candidatus Peribacteria bacterium]